MKYDFDKKIDRNNTDSIKFDFRKQYFGTKDVIPMWVADMDFSCLPNITEAIINRAKHPIYGYTLKSNDYYNAIINWIKRRYNWEIKKSWITFSPGVVAGINLIIQGLTNVDDEIIVQPPVYYPFFKAIKNNGRKLIENQLKLNKNRYEFDIDNFKKIITDKTKILILCNPHNPVGRVWTKEELLEISKICLENNIIVISDEIHGDIILNDNKFIPFASLSDEISNITITLNAPSKTFNVAGLSTSSVIISNPMIRKQYKRSLENIGIELGNIFGLEALKVGYNEGEEWVNQLNFYLSDNLRYLKTYLEENLPKIKLIESEGTYLAWLDCRELNFKDNSELNEFMIKKAKVGFSNGIIFGKGGEGFLRLNIGTQKLVLEEVLNRLKNAFIE